MPRHRDAGAVTAELAVALPVLVLLLTVAVGMVSAVTAQLHCVDAAREGARAAARGEPRARVITLAREVAPPKAEVLIGSGRDRTVAVSVAAQISVAGRVLAPVRVVGRAVALVEPGVTP